MFTKFDEYSKPRTQKICECCFNNREQEAGKSISVYMTKLHVIAKNCVYDEIKIRPDEIVHDHMVLGVQDEKVWVLLLPVNDLV